ncbi:hypothetical protein BDZ97DRAFT_1754924 [Flammula alnicola]|nr:hypothetical protein BDZ97DRAFT_1754924 [Flammula alnicola]
MNSLDSPACTAPSCDGLIFKETVDSRKRVKRHPIKIIPHVSLLQSVRHMVRRKGFRRLVRDSRNTPSNQNSDPDFIMKDMHDGNIWHDLETGIKREVGNLGTVRDVPNAPGTKKKLTDHRFGLHMNINLDWFGALENRPHSSGPFYVSFSDLPREQRFLQVNVICPTITPGPNEPTTRQLNHCMEPIVVDVKKLKDGMDRDCQGVILYSVEMEMFDEDDKEIVLEVVAGDFTCNNCDTPGAHKMSGFAGHSADLNPCPWCRCTSLDINQPAGYTATSFVHRNDSEALKQKFYSKDAPLPRQAAILKNHGVQWSALDWIPGWRPSKQTPLDFMHCIFLGIVAFLFKTVLFAAHMFPGAGGQDSTKNRFENAINSVRWPTHVTRLPTNMGENQSLKKADEWRRLLTVSPVILWCSWRDETDTIPDAEPPVAPNEKIQTQHSQNMRSLYDAILLLCAGMHFADMIALYGPVYAWWLFAFERFNGMLEKVNHNGHDGGRIELTMLRNWVQTHLIYELLLGLPDDAHPHERDLIERILKTEGKRGGMMAEIAIFRSEACTDCVSLPKQLPKPLNLYTVNLRGQGADGTDLYSLLFEYLKQRWPILNLRRAFSLQQEGTPFIGTTAACRLPYIRKDGIRYGFAFILRDGVRVPVEIEDLFMVKIPGTDQPAHACALVRRLRTDNNLPILPWDL